ncbi:superoxide dismutase family protein [Marinicauda algicola]|uniref:Superoxide dismutase family protein n=1 Tax=Marinicauda algicola TaxID=2029849 RepID=A0A4S2H2V9_9PROT|nr:superoxide dismutase family protein [Marinicauda algicola]TGY89671.1 superoxide dismutase family protein [Marinicauda algicola]
MTRFTLSAFTAITLLGASACGQAPEAEEQGAAPGGDIAQERTEETVEALEEADEIAGTPAEGEMSEPRAGSAIGTILDNEMNEVGTLTLTQGPQGVLLRIEADGLAEAAWNSWHGAHLHETGDCSASDFTSAGSHINTLGNEHGLLNPNGPDNADMPNLWVHEGGVLRAEVYTTHVSIDGQTNAPALLDADGSALIVHTNADDQRSQPIGGAGARILCAVIEPGQ